MEVGIGQLVAITFQAMVIAETVALVTARRRLTAEEWANLGTSWHRRLKVLTQMVKPTEGTALLVAVAILLGGMVGAVA
jgi:hypothetical protein